MALPVVEALRLEGYDNLYALSRVNHAVVEALRLEGYDNLIAQIQKNIKL